MKIFQSAEKYLKNLGISRDQSRLNGKVLMEFTCYWVNNTLNCIFLVREVKSFSELVTSIFVTSETIAFAIFFTIFIIQKDKFFQLISVTEEIADRVSENRSSPGALYKETIRQIEKWNRIIYNFISMFPLAVISPKFIASLFMYFTTDLGNSAFVLPAPTWIPFDWKNPIGYLIAVSLEYTVAVYIYAFLGCLATLGCASFLFQTTTIRGIKNSLNLMNESFGPHGDRLQIFRKLTDFIEIHSKIKQMWFDFSEVCEPFFFVLFTSAIVTICVSMLLIQTELKQTQMDPAVLLTACIFAWLEISTVFIVCEISQRGCDTFNGIDAILEQWNWYLLPIEIQRMLPIIFIDMQQPVELKCFGSIACNRDSFKKIINKAYSYFMTLRNFIK